MESEGYEERIMRLRTKTSLDPRQPWPFPKQGEKLKKVSKKQEQKEFLATLPLAPF